MKAVTNPAQAKDTSQVGTYTVYDRAGKVLWVGENFRRHVDTIPGQLSLSMGAARLVDPKTKAVYFTWDPWDVLKKMG